MSLIDKFTGLRVLVVGDIMIDSYYFGKVDRISPEAPVPVVAVSKKENRLGGAANVALNLVALGALPTVCSVIGKDKDGDDLIDLLKENKVGINGVVRSATRITTVKTRVIAQNHQMLRIDSEQTQPVTATESYELVDRFTKLLQDCDVVLFEDYDKGVLTDENIKQITQMAHHRGIAVVVDPKKRNFSSYTGVDLFKPNLKELKEGAGIDVNEDDREAFEQSLQKLMQKMQLKNLMVTMSEKGVLITNGKDFHYVSAHFRKIADVSGAGDTVISVAALCMALGTPLKQLAELSNLAGGLVCEEVGVVPVQKSLMIAEAERLAII
ncbi:MAG: bifunctional heptose 7-phosphate kinase/heptose 1-phosphate adenyltransferase [Bacteroidota bacterium]|jgi:rfaE bifunctional protein kinase chain/domain